MNKTSAENEPNHEAKIHYAEMMAFFKTMKNPSLVIQDVLGITSLLEEKGWGAVSRKFAIHWWKVRLKFFLPLVVIGLMLFSPSSGQEPSPTVQILFVLNGLTILITGWLVESNRKKQFYLLRPATDHMNASVFDYVCHNRLGLSILSAMKGIENQRGTGLLVAQMILVFSYLRLMEAARQERRGVHKNTK